MQWRSKQLTINKIMQHFMSFHVMLIHNNYSLQILGFPLEVQGVTAVTVHDMEIHRIRYNVLFSGEFSAETQCTSEEAISIWTSMPSCRPRETIVKVPQMADPRLFQVRPLQQRQGVPITQAEAASRTSAERERAAHSGPVINQ